MIQDLIANQNYFLRWLKSLKLAEADTYDILQEGYLKVLSIQSDLYPNRDKTKFWFKVILKNILIDQIRFNKKLEYLDPDELERVSIESENPSVSTSTDICSCSSELLKTLSQKDQQIINKIEFDENTVTELAIQMKIKPSSLYVKFHRAKSRLKSALFKFCGVTSFNQCLDCDCSLS